MNEEGRLEMTFIFVSNDGSEEKFYVPFELKRNVK